jgi:hypothetical protein
MPRPTLLLAVAAAAAAVVVPAAAAGAGSTACTAWGTLPARATLGPHGLTLRPVLHGTAACKGVTADSGGTATLQAPVRKDDVPMRWSNFGDSDSATFYPSINRPGTYRLVDGRTQTYDANYERIPASWRVTSTVVKDASRLVHVGRTGSGVSATLQAYGRTGWQAETGVRVSLQRRAADGSWHVVARARTASNGRVLLRHGLSSTATYRIVAGSTTTAWGAVRGLSASRA